jgi:acyl-coenzyme A thioesterase 13
MHDTSIPEGFTPIKRLAAFMDMLGPIYVKSVGRSRIVALRIAEKHLNNAGIAHGGMLVTLADSALGINISYHEDPPRRMVTVNLSTDFLQPARLGDWLEAHVTVQRVGMHLAFASCDLKCGQKQVLRASGVFAILAAGAQIPSSERFDG